MKCEYCKEEHTGSYGSGRFCNEKCAHGFSTKAKRKEINKKVSRQLKNRFVIEREIRKCLYCDEEFETQINSSRKYCSKKCSHCYCSIDTRQKLSKIRIKYLQENGSSNWRTSIHCLYKFKNTKIKCDSKLEYSALEYFIKNFNVINIIRFKGSIEYLYENNIKRFIPDFIITTDKNIYIVECKFDRNINTVLSNKWYLYLDKIDSKKIALKKYCKENNYEYMWYTDETDNKLYRKCKPLEIILHP